MNELDRPRPVTSGQLNAGFTELAGKSSPEYSNDVLRQVARTRQRPGWTFPERWIPMPIALRLAVVPRALVILLLLVGLTLAMLAALATVGGSPSPFRAVAVPPPVGLAGNGLIAYDSAGDIWVADADGSDPRVLIGGPAVESSPVWSPDGTRLAYWSQESIGAPSDLVVVASEGTGPVTVATDPFGGVPIRISWSPDGSALAYPACEETAGPECTATAVFVAAADGSGSRQVSDPDLGAAWPDWSPDGSLLAFQGTPAAGGVGAYVMASDGTDTRRLSALPDGGDYTAYLIDWTPDGLGLVTQAGAPQAIFLVSADGETASQLSAPSTNDSGIPSLSPDGRWVAYQKDMRELALLSTDGETPPGWSVPSVGAVEWSPDAKRLVGTTNGGTAFASLVILDAATGERLAAIDGLDQGYPGQAHYASWQRVAS